MGRVKTKLTALGTTGPWILAAGALGQIAREVGTNALRAGDLTSAAENLLHVSPTAATAVMGALAVTSALAGVATAFVAGYRLNERGALWDVGPWATAAMVLLEGARTLAVDASLGGFFTEVMRQVTQVSPAAATAMMGGACALTAAAALVITAVTGYKLRQYTP